MKGSTECYKTSNNKFFNCPYHMSDGRHFTDYRPKCLANYSFPTEKSLNSYEYRQYLIANADSIMQQNKEQAYVENSCGPCMKPLEVGTMLPEQNIVECDASTCKVTLNDQNGLGNGRKYSANPDPAYNAFIKYKTKEQEILSTQRNRCTTSEDDLQLYPYDNSLDSSYARYVVPSGADPLSARSAN